MTWGASRPYREVNLRGISLSAGADCRGCHGCPLRRHPYGRQVVAVASNPPIEIVFCSGLLSGDVANCVGAKDFSPLHNCCGDRTTFSGLLVRDLLPHPGGKPALTASQDPCIPSGHLFFQLLNIRNYPAYFIRIFNKDQKNGNP